MNRIILNALAIILTVLILSSCASMTALNEQDTLRTRVQTFWDGKKNRNWEKVYQLYCQDYRERVSLDEFRQIAKMQLKSFFIEELAVHPSGGTAIASIRFDSNVQGFDLSNVRIRERWIKEKGSWYACPENRDIRGMFKNE